MKTLSKCACRAATRLLLSLASFAISQGCQAHQEKSTEQKNNEQYALLGLVGYNYTDRHISSYSVNGAGGGHIFLSSPTSGGSGVTCCVKFRKNSTVPIRVKVRWQVDGCKYVESNPRTGASAEVRHFYFKEAEVDVQRLADDQPAQIETHFYPDGTVRVLLTTDESIPRMALNDKRPDKSLFPRCKDDKKPEE
jgi:hypothetical protein